MPQVAYTSNLVESGTRRYIGSMLVRSHEFRRRHYNFFFNVGLTLFLFGLVSLVLYYKRRTRETPTEADHRLLEKRNYVLNRLSQYNKKTLSTDGAFNTPLSANSPLLHMETGVSRNAEYAASDGTGTRESPVAAGASIFREDDHDWETAASGPRRSERTAPFSGNASDWYQSMLTYQDQEIGASASQPTGRRRRPEDEHVIPQYSRVNPAVEASLYL